MSAKIIEGQLKFCTSCMVYSHTWLNIPRDESHFFYIFIWMLVWLKTKIPKTNTGTCMRGLE